MIEVIKPGLLDLVMDLGRPGFRMQGVPQGGAADIPSLIHANRLVGNPDHAAGLEMTLFGPELIFPAGGVVAYVGADMGAKLEGVPMLPGCRYDVAAGAKLRFERASTGLRAYLAVAGGIEVPMLLGSRSTFLPGGWGGWQGRALKAGDRLPTGMHRAGGTWDILPEPSVPARSCLRVLPGPQIGGFSDSALASFQGQEYEVLPDSNRVGIRLKGASLNYGKAGLLSQAVLPGTIQVPPSGQPIILGWDGPVTGGYPVIAGVIAADLPSLAQIRPGDRVKFHAISREAACSAWQRETVWIA